MTSDSLEYIDRLTLDLEVRSEVMAEVEENLSTDVTDEHDERFGEESTNKLVRAHVTEEAELRFARRQRMRASGRTR